MLGAGGAQLGQRRGAISDAQRAARLKRTAGWERGERRHCAGNRLELVAHELRRSPQEARSIGMPRVFEHFSRRASYSYQLEAFAAAVRGGPNLTPPADSVANMRVIDAIYAAAGMKLRGS